MRGAYLGVAKLGLTQVEISPHLQLDSGSVSRAVGRGRKLVSELTDTGSEPLGGSSEAARKRES